MPSNRSNHEKLPKRVFTEAESNPDKPKGQLPEELIPGTHIRRSRFQRTITTALISRNYDS
jgi:hypothetical protein